MMIVFILTAIVCILLAFFYISETKKGKYWSSREVKQVEYKKMLGILWDYVFHDGCLAEVYQTIYQNFPNEPYVGAIQAGAPILVLKDPKIIQYVLRTEYQNFLNRGAKFNYDVDKLADNLLFMDGTRWKLMRQKLTPVFTSGKLRKMFYIINKNGQDFKAVIQKIQKEGSQHGSLFNTMCAYATSSIGASVFGINTNMNENFDSPLQNMARKANSPGIPGNIRFMINSLFPKIFSLLKLKVFGAYDEFFINLVKRMLRSREQESVKRHDFIDNCLEIQKDGKMCDPTTGYEMEPTDELMAAQAFFFFIAGVDPTATVIHCTLYELAKNPEIQDKLRNEVDDIFSEFGENLTYDAVDKMEYLEKVLNESMRMYPPIGNIQRKCLKDSVLPGGLKIDNGVFMVIPILAIHKDPLYYPNPEEYDPERFDPKVEKQRPNYTFLPFGEGNRICIGVRFAKLQIKTGLVHLLREFSVQLDREVEPVKFQKSFFSLCPKNCNYKFVSRQK